MEDTIKRLLSVLTQKTVQKICKWTEGTEEGEFYARISEQSVLYSFDNIKDEYKMSLLNNVGKIIFKVVVSKTDAVIFPEAENLYKAIEKNRNDANAETLEGFITKLDGEEA